MTEVIVNEDRTPNGFLFHKKISWAAIFAGVFVMAALQLLFGLLGLGIGASTVDPLTEVNPLEGLGTMAYLWFLITGLVSLFIGGLVSGHLTENRFRFERSLHGFMSWAIMAMVSVFLMTTTLGSIIGGASKTLGNSISALSQSTTTGVAGVDTVRREILGYFQSGNANSSAQGTIALADPQALGVVERIFSSSSDRMEVGDKETLTDLLVLRSGMSRENAAATVGRWDNNFVQAKVKAREMGDATARGIAKASLWAFLTYVLGAIVATWGGAVSAFQEGEVFNSSKTRRFNQTTIQHT